jgi:hypothetical protein
MDTAGRRPQQDIEASGKWVMRVFFTVLWLLLLYRLVRLVGPS